jgi:hypothetical protein
LAMVASCAGAPYMFVEHYWSDIGPSNEISGFCRGAAWAGHF